MDIKQEILMLYFREGKSLRSISAQTRLSRKTVTRYVREHEGVMKAEGGLHNSNITKPPGYDSSTRQARVLTASVKQKIDDYLALNQKRLDCGQRKQLLKRTDIHELLREEGIKIGLTTVSSYVSRQLKKRSKEAFIRQQAIAAQECEFDWGEVKIFIKDKLTTFQMAVFTSNYSNHRFGKLFHRQDTLAFQQSHVDYFNAIGGVHRRMVYDNMRVAIARFTGTQKEPTRALKDLSRWYNFEYRFCNIYSANEKGHVERSVEYLRRKVFARRDHFESLQAANAYFKERCVELNQNTIKGELANIATLFEQERPKLGILPEAFPCRLNESCRVDKYSTISYKTNRYSVPDHLVGERLDLLVYVDKIEAYWQDQHVCSHQIRYTKHQWYLKLEHYLKTMSKKPGSVKNSVALSQAAPFYQSLFKDHFSDNPRDFIALITYVKDQELSLEKLRNYCHECSQKSFSISLSKIKILHYQELHPNVSEEQSNNTQIARICENQLYQHAQMMQQNHLVP